MPPLSSLDKNRTAPRDLALAPTRKRAAAAKLSSELQRYTKRSRVVADSEDDDANDRDNRDGDSVEAVQEDTGGTDAAKVLRATADEDEEMLDVDYSRAYDNGEHDVEEGFSTDVSLEYLTDEYSETEVDDSSLSDGSEWDGESDHGEEEQSVAAFTTSAAVDDVEKDKANAEGEEYAGGEDAKAPVEIEPPSKVKTRQQKSKTGKAKKRRNNKSIREALGPAPPHLKYAQDVQVPSGADFLHFLIDGAEDKAEETYWTRLPGCVVSQTVSQAERDEHFLQEQQRRDGIKAILARHRHRDGSDKQMIEDREWIKSTGFTTATIGSLWRYPPPSPELNGEVFNPAGSTTMRLIGAIVPLVTNQTLFNDMYPYPSPPNFARDEGSCVTRPFLSTPAISVAAAEEIHEYVEELNIGRHFERALPPPGQIRLSFTNGADVKAEVEKALEMLEEHAAQKGRNVSVIRRRRITRFDGVKLNSGEWVDGGERELNLIYVFDKDANEIVSCIIPLDHASYYAYSGQKAFGSAKVTEWAYSLFADLTRLDNAALGPESAADATRASAMARTPTTDSSSSSFADEHFNADVTSSRSGQEVALVTLIAESTQQRSISAASPLAKYLATTTSSQRFSLQCMTRFDVRTDEEKREQHAKSVGTLRRVNEERRSKGKKTSHDKMAETQQKQNEERRSKGQATSHDKMVETQQKKNEERRSKGQATSHDKMVATTRERNEERRSKGKKTSHDEMAETQQKKNEERRSKGQATSHDKMAATQREGMREKARELEQNPPADIVAKILSFATAEAWYYQRQDQAKSEFLAVGGFVEGVPSPDLRKSHMVEWIRARYFPSEKLAVTVTVDEPAKKEGNSEILRRANLRKALALQANPPADVVASIRSFANVNAWCFGRNKEARREFRAVGGYIEGVLVGDITTDQIKAWIAERYFPEQVTPAERDEESASLDAKPTNRSEAKLETNYQRALLIQQNPPADVVAKIRSYRNAAEWYRGRDKDARREFKAVGGIIRGVPMGKVTAQAIREWMEENYFKPVEQ